MDDGDRGEVLATRIVDFEFTIVEGVAEEKRESGVSSAVVFGGATGEESAVAEVAAVAGTFDRVAVGESVAGASEDLVEEVGEVGGEVVEGGAEHAEDGQSRFGVGFVFEGWFGGDPDALIAVVEGGVLVDEVDNSLGRSVVFGEEDGGGKGAVGEALVIAIDEVAKEFDGGSSEAVEALVVVANNGECAVAGTG